MKKQVYQLTLAVALCGLTSTAQKALTPRFDRVIEANKAVSHLITPQNIPEQAIWSLSSSETLQTPDPRFEVKESRGITTRAEDDEVLLSQDFSLVTEGSESDLVPISLTGGSFSSIDDLMISPEYMGSEGWWGFGVYGAGNQVALAIPNYGGLINTPAMDMYGSITINIRAKLREGSGYGFFWLTCQKAEDGNLLNGSVVNNLPTGEGGATNMCRLEDEEWHDFSITVLNPYEGDSWFQINGTTYSKTGIMIDRIEITRSSDFAVAPSNLLSYDFTDEGFTARWEPGANNSSYLMTLIEQSADGEDQTLSTDFNNIKLDENGTITQLDDLKGVEVYLTENKGTADEGFEESGAIIFTSDNDGLILPDLESPILSASMYLKANISPNSNALLYIMAGSGNGYPMLDGSIPLNQAVAGNTFDLANYTSGLGSIGYLMFQPFGLAEGESLIVDDIQWTVSAPMKEETLFEDKPYETNIAVLTGLNPANEYSFAVKGVSEKGTVSSLSAFHQALGCPAPKVKEATDIDASEGCYTANWEPSVKAQSYEVCNFESRKMTEDIEDYVILYDDFENASDPDGYGVELPGNSFNGLADNNGWTSEIGIFSESSIGSYWGADVTSPYLSLGNDNGRFKVRTQLTGFPGMQIILQCNVTSFQVASIPFEGDYDELISEEFEFTFEDGTDFTQLMLYANSYDAFLIQDIEVLQNVSKDDVVLSFKDSKTVNGHDSNSCEFTGLMPSDEYDYAYAVTAIGSYMGTGYRSTPSSPSTVNFATTGVSTCSESTQIQMFVSNGMLSVSLPNDAVISVYDVVGKKVKESKGHTGINTVSLDNSGVYIVKIGDISRKIYVNI